MIMVRDEQIPGDRSPWWLNFMWWHLILWVFTFKLS